MNDKSALTSFERGDTFRGHGRINFCGGHNNSFGRGRGRGAFRKCNWYEKTNHTIETCLELHESYHGLTPLTIQTFKRRTQVLLNLQAKKLSHYPRKII